MLRAGGGPADAVWPGDDDAHAGHFAVYVSGAAVAVATVVPEPHPVDPQPGDFRLRGMATDERHRGRGYAGLLTAACVEHARGAGARRVWLQARPAAVGVYSRAGFVWETEEFEVPGLGPHIRMSRKC